MNSVGETLTIDLVVGSVGRFDHLRRLAGSLASQSYRNFSLIVVEQADPAQAQNILSQFPGLRWRVFTSERGLSRARNRGLMECNGDVVGFPDDDCWYEVDTLARVAERFIYEPQLNILIGVMRTTSGAPCIRTPSSPMMLNRKNIWRVGISPACFFRASAIAQIGTFDPILGVGSGTAYQSGEETEFLLRGIDGGLQGKFDPNVTIRHPSIEEGSKGISRQIGYGYGMGMGLVLRRHSYHWSYALQASTRPLMGAGIALLKGQKDLAQFRTAVSLGRFSGYFRHPSDR